MGTSNIDANEASKPRHYFATTHWSVVLAAGKHDTVSAEVALEKLCSSYWYPLYAYVRKRGISPHDAQDLTQAFFASIMEKQSLANVDPQRGRFRSFLIGAMNHFLASEWRKSQAQKRGGGNLMLSLDLAMAEQRLELEPADFNTPDQTFDKAWAAAVLENVLQALEAEYQLQKKELLFQTLKQTLTGSRDAQPYSELAQRLDMNEGAVKTAVHRLRKRYRELLQTEVANTVGSAGEVEDEMRYLFRAIQQ